jgi:hypothetical protein
MLSAKLKIVIASLAVLGAICSPWYRSAKTTIRHFAS